jgi:hypothetical protein
MVNAAIANFYMRCLTEILMSSEQIKIDTLEIPKVIDSNISSKVDINQLISKAREKERKENKLNYILLSIAGSIILSIALTLSL